MNTPVTRFEFQLLGEAVRNHEKRFRAIANAARGKNAYDEPQQGDEPQGDDRFSIPAFNKGDYVSCGGKEPFTVYSVSKDGKRVHSGKLDFLGKQAITCAKVERPASGINGSSKVSKSGSSGSMAISKSSGSSGSMAISGEPMPYGSSKVSKSLSGGRATRRSKRSGKKAKKTRGRR
jgi:hypothetical protein